MISNGIDLINISRFENLINDNTFLESIFNPSEIEYINKHKSLDTIAGLFASKEAMLKALKKVINNYSLKDIEILHDSNNAPYVVLHNEIKKENDIDNISLSISHDSDYAIAIVTLILK